MADRPPHGTVALISLYDIENNAVRQLAAGVRARGCRVVEIYLKDWVTTTSRTPPRSSWSAWSRITRRTISISTAS